MKSFSLTPEGRPYWIMPEMERRSDGEEPLNYGVEEVAKFFFNRSASWLRLRTKPDPDSGHPNGWFVDEDGEPLDIRRVTYPSGVAFRRFRLSDIERMAWSLHRFGAIDRIKLAAIIGLVTLEGVLHGILAPHEIGLVIEEAAGAAEPAGN